jgi:hypothetical protein
MFVAGIVAGVRLTQTLDVRAPVAADPHNDPGKWYASLTDAERERHGQSYWANIVEFEKSIGHTPESLLRLEDNRVIAFLERWSNDIESVGYSAKYKDRWAKLATNEIVFDRVVSHGMAMIRDLYAAALTAGVRSTF